VESATAPAVPRRFRLAGPLVVLLALTAAGGGAAELRLVEAERFELPYPDYVEPVAVAAGPLGQLFIADRGRGTVLRVGAGGRVEYEFESPSAQPGLQPLDLEVTGFQVYVLDALSKSLLRFTQEGGYLDLLQNFTGRTSGMPSALSVDGTGRVLVVDPSRHAVLLVDEEQQIESVIGGFGARPGELSRPTGVAFAAHGAFYVADTGNRRVQRYDEVGNYAGTLVTSLVEPRGLATSSDGVVFVADAGGLVHALTTRPEDLRQHAVLELPGLQPVDVSVQGETLWVLSRQPRLLLRVDIVRGQ